MSEPGRTGRFEILGPIRIRGDAGEVAVTAERDRIVLATLLLHVGDLVPVQRLIEAVWADQPPPRARNKIQGCMTRLRKHLAAAGLPTETIVTDRGGYRARVDPDKVDVHKFRARIAEARTAAAAGRREDATDLYRTALGQWRGPALAGIDGPQIRHTAAALEEERVRAQEECIEAELALGRSGELVAELTELVRQHPYREGLHGALMLALYRAGRQADALAAYRHVRQVLHDELGTEPGAELQRLHQAILNRDPDLAAPRPTARPQPPPAPTPRELPADVAGFTGRAEALRALGELLPDDAESPSAPVVISAIAGTAGVGKTALAIHWAHQVADRFPDGQLYINLRGYAAGSPLRPVGALAALLRSLGTPPEQIPSDEAQAAAAYRSQLAGRQVLVVLDNAGSVDQVRPLLPGSPGCLVMVTSRDRLAGLIARDGARRITLDVLSPDEARHLLTALLGAKRVQAEPDAATELARICAYLPLALRIAAANLIDHQHQTIAAMVTELVEADRLPALQVDNDEESAVQVALDFSYQRISPDEQRLFRLLGLVPGHDFTAAAAAALGNLTKDRAQQLLNRLASAHLVEERAPGRYTFHDLLRLYAKHRAEAEDDSNQQSTGAERLLGFYLHAANTATRLLYAGTARLPMPAIDEVAAQVGFGEPADALDWLDVERPNLVAAIYHAAEHGPRAFAWLLADHLRGYFWRRGGSADWTLAANAALTAAEREGDLRAQAAIQFGLADPHLTAGQYERATKHLQNALALAREAGWTAGEAMILGNLGFRHWAVGELSQAADWVTQAYALHRQAGSIAGQAGCHGNLGLFNREVGRLRAAEDHLLKAVTLFRELGSREGTADNLCNLGEVYHDLGEFQRADEHLIAGLAIARELGDRYRESEALRHLAAVYCQVGRLREALASAGAAVEIADDIGDRRAEAQAHSILGNVHASLGQYDRAVECQRRALALARQTGDRLPEADALIGLAAAYHRRDEPTSVSECAGLALDVARKVGYQVIEGQALTLLAEIHFGQGHYDDAYGYACSALDNHRATGHRPGEANTLAVLSRIRNALDGPGAARRLSREALKLFTEIGAPVPDDLRALDRTQEP